MTDPEARISETMHRYVAGIQPPAVDDVLNRGATRSRPSHSPRLVAVACAIALMIVVTGGALTLTNRPAPHAPATAASELNRSVGLGPGCAPASPIITKINGGAPTPLNLTRADLGHTVTVEAEVPPPNATYGYITNASIAVVDVPQVTPEAGGANPPRPTTLATGADGPVAKSDRKIMRTIILPDSLPSGAYQGYLVSTWYSVPCSASGRGGKGTSASEVFTITVN